MMVHQQRYINQAFTQFLTWALCALLLVGCGAIEIGIEHLPPNGGVEEVNWQATAETLQAEATRRGSEPSNSNQLIVAEPAPTTAPLVLPNSPAKVSYIYEGDVWMKTLPDGEAIRLTQDGNNQEPRWSASGEWLSFIKDPEQRELWVVRQDGSDAERIGTAGRDNYGWSLTEDKLAYGSDGSLMVFQFYEMTQAEGGSHWLVAQVQLAQPEDITRIGELAWSHSGQELAFTLRTELTSMTDDGGDNDGLWIIDVNGNFPVQLLASELPEKGQYILHGWSGDDNYLIYSQSLVLSASMLSDGVPLYRVPALGGTPQVMAESVVPHADFVRSQPNGLSQVAFIEGSGREVWHNKHLRSVMVSGMQGWELTPPDQAASSPAWSPAGNLIAYVGMPDVRVAGEDRVVGGPEAQTALNLRQLWISEPNDLEPRPIKDSILYREEAPVWIDDDTLLVARVDFDGRVSLWQMSKTGEDEQQVVEEITPAPEWFGFYGHIDWQPYFALWRPRTAAQLAMIELPPTVVSPMPLSPSNSNARTLLNFLQVIHPAITADEVMDIFGKPDEVTGSGLLIYQYGLGDYDLGDGVQIWLAFPGQGALTYAQLHTPDGKAFELTLLPFDPAQMPIAATPTPLPSVGEVAPVEMTPTPVPMDSH